MSRDRWSDHPCEALSALIDGELSAGERAAIEAHLGACPVCCGLREDFDRLGRLVADEAPPAVPGDLAARIRGRIEAGVPKRTGGARAGGWWRAPWRAPMPAAAAAAVLVTALVWLAWPGGWYRVAPTSVLAPEPPPAQTPATDDETRQAPIQAPAPTAGPVGADRDGVEPKIAPPTPAHGAVSRPSMQAPSVSRRDDRAPLALVDGAAAGDGGRQNQDAAKDAADAERGLPQGDLLETAAKREAPAKSAEMAANGPVAAAPGIPPAAMLPPAAARPARALVATSSTTAPLEASPYVVRLLPDGSMSVRTRDYQCAVPITQDDARLIATLGENATAIPVAAAPAAPGAATGGAAMGGAAMGGVASGVAAEPKPAVLSPEERQTILRLVRERYRAVIEARCGPLPR